MTVASNYTMIRTSKAIMFNTRHCAS